MLEIVCGIGLCVVMGRVASSANRSPGVWATITLMLCLLSLLVPVPFVRLLIPVVVVPVALFVCNLISPPRL